MTRRRQRVPQRVGILYYPVVHQADSARAVDVRVRVAFGDRPVGCPPRVTDARSVELRPGPLAHHLTECPDSPDRAQPRNIAAGGSHRDPNRVDVTGLEPSDATGVEPSEDDPFASNRLPVSRANPRTTTSLSASATRVVHGPSEPILDRPGSSSCVHPLCTGECGTVPPLR